MTSIEREQHSQPHPPAASNSAQLCWHFTFELSIVWDEKNNSAKILAEIRFAKKNFHWRKTGKVYYSKWKAWKTGRTRQSNAHKRSEQIVNIFPRKFSAWTLSMKILDVFAILATQSLEKLLFPVYSKFKTILQIFRHPSLMSQVFVYVFLSALEARETSSGKAFHLPGISQLSNFFNENFFSLPFAQEKIFLAKLFEFFRLLISHFRNWDVRLTNWL